jgi:hypothetical protein
MKLSIVVHIIIPVIGETEAVGSQSQASLGKSVRPCLQNKTEAKRAVSMA